MIEIYDLVYAAYKTLSKDKNVAVFLAEIQRIIEENHDSRRLCKEYFADLKLEERVRSYTTNPIFAPAAIRILRRIDYYKSSAYVSFLDIYIKSNEQCSDVEAVIAKSLRIEEESRALSLPYPPSPVKATVSTEAPPTSNIRAKTKKEETPISLVKKAVKYLNNKDDVLKVGKGIDILLKMTESSQNQIDRELLLSTNIGKIIESISLISVHKRSAECLMGRFARINNSTKEVKTDVNSIPNLAPVVPKRPSVQKKSIKHAYDLAKDMAEPVKKYEKFPEFQKRKSPEFVSKIAPSSVININGLFSPVPSPTTNLVPSANKENSAPRPVPKNSAPRSTLKHKSLRMAQQKSTHYMK